MSLTILVCIEMFNALNALSEDGSLLQMPPWANPYLLLAMVVSIGLHMVILYIPVVPHPSGGTPRPPALAGAARGAARAS